MSEKFSLKWNDFQINAIKTFNKLRNTEDYFDVTLVSSDQKKFQAHRIVLSACSSYFDNVLKSDKGSFVHLMLCLDNVNSRGLNSILDYIYNGEVQVSVSELDQFLAVADRFQLEGLTGLTTRRKVKLHTRLWKTATIFGIEAGTNYRDK